MKGFRNIKGYIMKKDLPLIRFACEGGMLQEVEILTERENLPLEYHFKVSDRRATELFLEDRVVPQTRQHLEEALQRVGIPYYDPELLLRYNKGVSVEDSYWVRLED